MSGKNDLQAYFDNNPGRLIHKWSNYFDIYERHLAPYRGQEVHMIEIGVYQGGSLQMWKDYLGPKAHIYGVDISPHARAFEEDRVKISIGDQSNVDFLASLRQQIPRVDILLDDGGHSMKQQITTFQELYHHVAPDGVYLCEDLHTSYWASHGGGLHKPDTFIEFSKQLIDQLSAWHTRTPEEFEVDDFTLSTQSMHFYDSMLVIEKRPMQPPVDRKTGKPSF